MTDNLDSGGFKIVSVRHENLPIGVDHTKPAWQIVRLDQPVQHWVFHKVGHNRYRLSISGYSHTGVLNNKVVASIHPEHDVEWEIEHQEYHNAYTISQVNESRFGWTVPINFGGGDRVELQPVTSTRSTGKPPRFLPTQLFLFRKQY